MRQEYDIWNEVLEMLRFKFQEEYTSRGGSNLLVYNRPNKKFTTSINGTRRDIQEAKLYVKFETGEITSFLIDGWQMKETFQKENIELFRDVKLKYILQ